MHQNEKFKELNPDQLQSLDWTRSLSVRANAGSGKTTVLIQRIVQILHNNLTAGDAKLRLDQIVAITFTRKAAAELRKKLRDALAECWTSVENADKHFWQARLDELPNCPIGTIDSLCHRLLRSAIVEGMLNDLDPSFGILQGMDRRELLDLTLRRTEQEAASAADEIRHAWDNWLTTQGRRDLEKALRDLLNGPFEPEECQGALKSFTGDMTDRVLEMLQLPMLTHALDELNRDRKGHLASIEAALAELRVLPAKELKLKSISEMIESLAVILGAAAQTDFDFLVRLRAALLTEKGTVLDKGFYTKEIPKSQKLHELSHRWQPILVNFKFDPTDNDGLDLSRQLILLFREARRHFDDISREENRFDFNQLAHRLIGVLERDTPRRLTRHFRFVLVDEFQDTNELHWRIISRLAGGEPDRAVRSDKLMIVGDPQQSIYRFRQADPTVFDRVEERIKNGNIEEKRDKQKTAHDQFDGTSSSESQRQGLMKLQENYRSFNPLPLKLIDKLSAHAFAKVGSRHQPLLAGSDKTEPRAEVIYVVPEEADADEEAVVDEIADGEAAPAISLSPKQLTIVAEQLRRLHDEQSFPWKKMAILVRSRNTVFKNLEETLCTHGIPFQLVGGLGFWQRQEVRDMVSLATCLANSADELALFAVLRGPFAGLDDSELLFLWTLGRRSFLRSLRLLSVLDDTLQIPSDSSDSDRSWTTGELDRLIEVIAELRTAYAQVPPERRQTMRAAAGRLGISGRWRNMMDRMPHADLLRSVLDETGAWAIYSTESEGERRIANLRMVLEEIRAIEIDRPGSLSEMARRLRQLVDESERDEQAEIDLPGGDAVQVMTVHAAKGLEFPVVAIVGLERQFRSDSAPIRLLDRFQHLREDCRDSELAKNLHGLPVLRFRDPEKPLTVVRPLLYQALGKIENKLGEEEEARIFHVAITRAKAVLILAGSAKPKKKCWQNWVSGALGLEEPINEGEWVDPVDSEVRVRIIRKASGKAVQKPLKENASLPELDLESIRERPRSQVIAATKLTEMIETFQKKPDEWRMQYIEHRRPHLGMVPEHLRRGEEPEPPRKRGPFIGTLVHRALEMGIALPNHPTERLDLLRAMAAGLTQRNDDEEPAFTEQGRMIHAIAATAAAIVDQLLGSSGELPRELRTLLDAPGEVEVEFILPVKHWRITGRFDKLIPGENGMLEIVDWKTEAESIDRIVEEYRDQMLLYALALYSSRPDFAQPVVVHLAMTHHRKVETMQFSREDIAAYRAKLESTLPTIH